MNASTEIIEGEVIDHTDGATRAVTIAPTVAPAIFGTTEPVEVLAKAQGIARVLKGVLQQQGLIVKIQGKDYPLVEAWTTLGSMLGVFPVLDWTRKLADGWEARVEARTLSGAVVGAAEAQCLRGERAWSNRDDFALRSMAQTRATAKALRMPLGFVMTLGGFQPTPAEEMDHPGRQPTSARQGGANGKAAADNTPEKSARRRIRVLLEEAKGGAVDAPSLAQQMADMRERYPHAHEQAGGIVIVRLSDDEAVELASALDAWLHGGGPPADEGDA